MTTTEETWTRTPRTSTRPVTLPLPARCVVALSLTAGACAPDAPAGNPPDVAIDTIGDTIVVRTNSGSVWGADATLVPEVSIGEVDGAEEYLFGAVSSIAVDDERNVYVLDWQGQEILQYDAFGNYVRRLARRGEGPGELAVANQMAFLPDGRLVVPDVRNGRINLFGPGANEREAWPLRDYLPSFPYRVWTDTAGQTYTLHLAVSDPAAMFKGVVIVHGPDGTHLDTLPSPTPDFERAEISVTFTTPSGGMGLRTEPLPFSPEALWTRHPHGGIVKGISSDYRIDLQVGDRVLRIERAIDPIPVSPAERDHHHTSITEDLRYVDPDWEWNGPPIPETKPVFKRLHSGRDGRIWVELSSELRDNTDPSLGEKVRFDVFEPDGTYLGAVNAPADFSTAINPVFDRDHVWAVTRGELDVQRVVRYRIVRE
ncbi:MAG: 6-bladed beta-propeller [Gemmatimonadota bacterium]|nr:6-bladed beta-propeller [Gemmatimonadota bacterium]